MIRSSSKTVRHAGWFLSSMLAAALLAGSIARAEPRAGAFSSGPPHFSELHLMPLDGDGRFRVELTGHGDPGDGPAIGADCLAVAEGVRAGDVLLADFVPFEGEGFNFSADDLRRVPRRLALRFGGDRIDVQGDFDYCAWRTLMAGQYQALRAGEEPR